jgi:transposase-like protein
MGATTAPKIRAEIQSAPSSITDSELARQYGITTAIIRRWRYRDDVHDRPHTRHNLLATLTTEQEEVLIAAREFLRLGLDDLLVVTREFLNPHLSRSGLHRMLKRRDVPTLAERA